MFGPDIVNIIVRNPDAAMGIAELHAESSRLKQLMIRHLSTMQGVTPAEWNEMLTLLDLTPRHPSEHCAFCATKSIPAEKPDTPPRRVRTAAIGDTGMCRTCALQVLNVFP